MAKLYNLARMTTATTGTGTITLGSAVSSFLSFADAGVQDGETVTYAIQDGSQREIGRGVYTASGTTLTRSVLKSTNSNSSLNLSGSAQVFITPAAEDFIAHPSLAFTSDTGSTADSDNGNGLVWWNNATQASATVLYFDDLTADGANLNTSFYDALGVSGFIHLIQEDDPAKWQVWKWTGPIVDASGYRKFPVTLLHSNGSIADAKTVRVSFVVDRPSARTVTITTGSAPTPNADITDEYTVTALGEAAAFGAPTGAPYNGQVLIIRIKDDGTGRALTWDGIYRAVGVTLPTTTVAGKTHYLGMIYNSTNTKWDVLAVAQEA